MIQITDYIHKEFALYQKTSIQIANKIYIEYKKARELEMLKKVKNTRLRVKNGKRANKNIRKSRKHTKKQNSFQSGGSASYNHTMNDLNMGYNTAASGVGTAGSGASSGSKEKFQITTLRSMNQDDLDRFKISNYVNSNIDWGDLIPGPPPVDCCIM